MGKMRRRRSFVTRNRFVLVAAYWKDGNEGEEVPKTEMPGPFRVTTGDELFEATKEIFDAGYCISYHTGEGMRLPDIGYARKYLGLTS